MDSKQLTELLEQSRRPKLEIYKNSDVLESEQLEHKYEISEVDGQKYIVETTIIQATTRYVTVRKYDPESHYRDAIEEFVNKDE